MTDLEAGPPKSPARLSSMIDGKPVGGTDSPVVVTDKYHHVPAFEVAAATRADVDRAVHVAAKAVARPLAPHTRADILFGAAALLRERSREFVAALVREAGKPYQASENEVGRAATTLQWSAEEAKRQHGEAFALGAEPRGEGRFGISVRKPIGVVAAITPFNSPLNLVTHKVGPALAAGNAVVLKPARRTPVCSLLLHDVLRDAGLPTGLCSVLVGPEVGDALLDNPLIDAYTFTGSTAVGLELRKRVGLRPSLLELGGNSPVIVHADADVALAAKACASTGFSNAGQACTAAQRVLVQRSIHDEFLERFIAEVEELVVGDPASPDTHVGPLISEAEAKRVETWIDEAVAQGATLIAGGPRDRALIPPAIVVNPPKDARVICDEVFGPVVSVQSYEAIHDAFEAANDTPYGLHAAIFTDSLDIAWQAVLEIDAGGVLVNEGPQWRTEFVPFGGVKQSGIGREGPRYVTEELSKLTLAMIRPSTPAAGKAAT